MDRIHPFGSQASAATGRRRRLKELCLLFAVIMCSSVVSLGALAGPAAAMGTVIAYPLLNLDSHSNYTATPSADARISMTVGGTAVNVQDNLGSAQTRFEMDNSPETVVITDTAGVTNAVVRPVAFGIVPVISGNTITFTLPQPEDFAVDINGVRDALLVFADPLEVSPPHLGDANVVNVMSFAGVNNTGTTETSALQSALNYVSAHYTTTPILYFPAGVYRTALLTIPSNAQVYLSSGAAILADGIEPDYPTIPGQVGVTSSTVFAVRGASNVKIFGRGVVDGNGYNLLNSYGQSEVIFDLFTDGGTNNLTINDVMFTNSVMLQSHIQGSHDVSMTNVKFNNPPGNVLNEDDALKINGSYNVTFTKGWLSDRDDTMTFAAVGSEAIYNTSNVTVSNTVLDSSLTTSAAIRFADIGSGQTMSGINVSNIYDISWGRAETFLGIGGGTVYQNSWGGGIVLDHWNIESPAPLVRFGSPGSPAITVSGITISNITSPGVGGGTIQGDSTNSWNNIHFVNVMSGGVMATDSNSLGLTINSYATTVDVSADSATTDLALNATSRPATITSTSVASGNSASAAADGNFGTFFKSAPSPTFPQYATVTWPVAHTFSGVTLVCDHCQGQAPSNWDVQVSTDGSTNWTTVASSGNVSWQYNDNSYESRLVSFAPVTAQGVRIQINNANEIGTEYQIDELEISPANSAPAATATTTSLGSGYSASAASDGDWNTFFKSASAPTFPQYYTLEWPAPRNIGAVSVVCDYCASQAPTNWTVQVSANGVSNWTTVATSGSVSWPGPNDGTRQTDMVSFTPVTAMAVRLQIANANLAFGSYQIDEVETMPASLKPSQYVATQSGLCLDDPNGSNGPTYVQIWNCLGNPQQQWTYTANQRLQVEGLCLDASGAVGAQAVVNTCGSSSTQQWIPQTDGTFRQVKSGLCLNVNGGGTTAGTQLSLASCQESAGAVPSQVWTSSAVVNSKGVYVNGQSGNCVDDPGGSTSPGTNTQAWACNGGANQSWVYATAAKTMVTEGLCLDAAGGGTSPGTVIDLGSCSGQANQQWNVNANGTISGLQSGLCMDLGAPNAWGGTQLVLQTCGGASSQKWTNRNTQAYQSPASSLCLDDPGSSTTPGTFIDVASCSGGVNQQLTYTSREELTTEGLCLDGYQGGTTPGTPVDLYTCQGGSNQQWILNSNGTISGILSGLCLQEMGTTGGAAIDLETCNATNSNQIWNATQPPTP